MIVPTVRGPSSATVAADAIAEPNVATASIPSGGVAGFQFPPTDQLPLPGLFHAALVAPTAVSVTSILVLPVLLTGVRVKPAGGVKVKLLRSARGEPV